MPKPDFSLSQFIPESVLRSLKDRIKAGVCDAEAKFRFGSGDEDSVTGALGQAISTATPIRIIDNGRKFEYTIESHKLRGRGPGAPEKHLGADGIFQISVKLDGKRCFSKGLPFQSKMYGGFSNKTVREQAEDLFRTSGTGIIIRYSDKGYTGMDVRDIIEPEYFTHPWIAKPAIPSLGTLFGDDFLDCRIGLQGLIYDRDKFFEDKKGNWVINAIVEGESFYKHES